ncbi:hypothetical protein [Nocardia asteroides]|uniref:hypothetical protein n=1 Tax=Nocardia asteroides TaxID=1824 RepID=UPI0034482F6A
MDPADLPPTAAFLEFSQNLAYARNLVGGGEALASVGATKLDVTDIFRAALVQGVSAFDHWLYRESVQRAVELIQDPGAKRPEKFKKLTVTVELFENVHHHEVPLDQAFRERAEQFFSSVLSPNPRKIQEAFAYLVPGRIWPKVAKALTDSRQDGVEITDGVVVARLGQIVDRRNSIAHESDRDLTSPTGKRSISPESVLSDIDWIEMTAAALLTVVKSSS